MRRLRERLHRLLVPVADGQEAVAAAPPVPMREIFRRFWPDARPYRPAIAAGVLFLVLVPAIEAAEIWLFKLVVDDVLVPRDAAALLPLAGIYLGLTLVNGIVRFGDDYLAAWVGERFLLNLRARLFSHVQGLGLDVLDRRRLGDLLSRLTSDVQAIERFVLTGVGDAISAVARIVFFSGALLLLSWRLALVSLVVVPLFWLTARRFSGLIKHASREKRRRSGSLTAVAEESLANAALVQSMGREQHELERFRRENAAIMEAELASTRIRSLFAPLVDLIELLGALVVVGLGVWALSSGDLTIGGLLVFLAYLSQLYSPVRQLSGLVNSLYAASAGAERVIELLDERPAVVDRPGAQPLPAAEVRGRVELRDVTYAYPGAARDALAGCSLVVQPGECVALAGPSGAGKTTVTRLLLRFADPAAGEVLLDGHDLRGLPLRDVRRHVGLLAQETLLFEGSVRDNIAYGRPDADAAEVERVARAVGIAELLDARVGQRGRALSGGQRQRVSIARAIVRGSAVVVLDEPTTGLDAEAREEVLSALDALLPGRTTIVVSHDPAVIARADRVVELRAPNALPMVEAIA
ncbi:ABC transporter ATP-binding protein [Conexibacter stalactiti]|uniref:ABC transporter ATP-binding protein n=1 Tax=Conexibacter stalactiti TaxID=1940611 RepID=A0ABU4HHQ4_9ACTN|nr:ABC transporter ATP-binding protein [Conexibacter stalactiti]MDW5592838.1 ABC transporter ATP-binding protein [Conexibacter stalactiti]MEC5033479.1 ABC transporter ATP-binding protein [Conexibacter stalactiti]